MIDDRSLKNQSSTFLKIISYIHTNIDFMLTVYKIMPSNA